MSKKGPDARTVSKRAAPIIKRPCKYFIAKHDLASFQAWKRVIWSTNTGERPRGLKKIQVGDRWIAFAYIRDEDERDKTQQVVGFYECVSVPDKRIEIPPSPRSLSGNHKLAWAIKGKLIGKPFPFPVTVPPIKKLLNRPVFGQQTLTPIHTDEFRNLQKKISRLQLSPDRIPLLKRDPRCEQEVVAMLVAAHTKFGIERVDRVRTRFPDMRVKLVGKRGLVHLEVETYSSSFLSHGHKKQVRARMLNTTDKSEKLPVAVVCWSHDDESGDVAACVHKVYELQDLLQRREQIRW